MDQPRRARKSDLPRDELGRLREPGAAEAFRRGAALFDERRYFESYIHFMLAWKPRPPCSVQVTWCNT